MINKNLNPIGLSFYSTRWVWIMVIAACISIFLPFYPGSYDNTDPTDIWQAASGIEPIYNWHAPFFQYFWRFLGIFGGLFLFNLFCYWVGLALTGYALLDHLWTRILFLVIIGFFPTNLYFIFFIRADMIAFSSMIVSFSLLAIYLFRFKKSFLLWTALFFIFIAIGVKQNLISFTLLFIAIISYLLLKHQKRFFKLPTFSYKKKSHVFLFFVLVTVVLCSTVMYINQHAERNFKLIWEGLLSWDLTATSVYSQEDLFYPQLLNNTNQGAISADQQMKVMNRYFHPQDENSAGLNHILYTQIKPFDHLNQNEQIFVLNQLAKNPIAYLYHRWLLTKFMLLQTPYWPWFRTNGVRWKLLNIHSSHGPVIKKLIQLFTFLILLSPSLLFFYSVNAIAFFLASLKIGPFNGLSYFRERICILIMSLSSFLLLLGLVFFSMANDFRYHLTAVYSAEINLVLILKIYWSYFSIQQNRKQWSDSFWAWVNYCQPRFKFLLLFAIAIFFIIQRTENNKSILYNHFNTILLNNTVQPHKIIAEYKNLSSYQILYDKKPISIFKNGDHLLVEQFNCDSSAKSNHFFLKVYPKSRKELYFNRLLYGYDEFKFNFFTNGFLFPEKKCILLAYLPHYPIAKIFISEMKPNKIVVFVHDKNFDS